MTLRIQYERPLIGTIRPPSDKSLTHRGILFGSLASAPCIVRKPLLGDDPMSMVDCVRALGTKVDIEGEAIRIEPGRWGSPKSILDCGNSGTAMRLLLGAVAGFDIQGAFTGDESLSRRPMERVATPLRQMGAEISGNAGNLRFKGSSPLRAIRFESRIASAQVKSAVLIAGLHADGPTTFVEPSQSRDHTERMFRQLGVSVERQVVESKSEITIAPREYLDPFETTIPGDISSAAFLMVAALLVPGSRVNFKEVGSNPTRTGIFEVFKQCGADVEILNESTQAGEPMVDFTVHHKDGLHPFSIDSSLVPRLIDEIPVLAILASQCHGVSSIRGAAELRVKETDRVEKVAEGLRKMGVDVETLEDGMDIHGPVRLKSALIDSDRDHRIGMAFAIAGLISDGGATVTGTETIATSYPDFERDLKTLTDG